MVSMFFAGPTQLRYEKYMPVHIEFENIGKYLLQY